MMKKNTDFFGDNKKVINIEIFLYNGHYQMHMKQINNSNGRIITEKFFYPYDITNPTSAELALIDQNRVEVIIKSETYDGTFTNFFSNLTGYRHTIYDYASPGELILPTKVKIKKNNTTVPEVRIVYDKYDTQGNLLQYTPADGLTTSILWGYGGQYPVAKIAGATYDEAVAKLTTDEQTAIQNSSYNDDRLRNVLNKLRKLDAMVTTYTFKPLVGMTSATGPDGKTVYYEYDAFNRLKTTMDDKHNILKKIKYNLILNWDKYLTE